VGISNFRMRLSGRLQRKPSPPYAAYRFRPPESLFHEIIRARLLYARPGATDEQIRGACAMPRSSTSFNRCPIRWTRWSGNAAIASPVARSSASSSPAGCRQSSVQTRFWWCKMERLSSEAPTLSYSNSGGLRGSLSAAALDGLGRCAG
jgi:hypothetical protein